LGIRSPRAAEESDSTATIASQDFTSGLKSAAIAH
jgi:hypothetical protein